MESAETNYNVVFSGKLLQGFDKDQVKIDFSNLFKLTPEKSERILTKRRTLKKALNQGAAENFKSKLERIGLEVVLEPQGALATSEPTLSLVPIEGESSTPATHNDVAPETKVQACPNCAHDLVTMTDPCPNCGVYPHKVISQSQPGVDPASKLSSPKRIKSVDHSESSDSLTLKGLIAGVFAALLGAVLWSGITVAIDYELGLIAWVIGGGIGYIVAFSGNRGDAAAIFCAVMALVAIIGGKYLFYSGLQSQVSDVLADSSVDLQLLYEEEMMDAQALVAMSNSGSISQFMVDYGYTEASVAESVTDDELNQFESEIAPRLMGFVDDQPTYEEWYQSTIEDNLKSISTFDLVIETFGFIDAIFLFLGISTAARIGYGKS
jgi:hypothetical protein